jgi:uncharacterized membrane protein
MRNEQEIRQFCEALGWTLADHDALAADARSNYVMMSHWLLMRWVLGEDLPEVQELVRSTIDDVRLGKQGPKRN